MARVREQQNHAGHTRVVTPLQGHPPLQRLYISRPRLRLDGQLGGAY
jgi:hypothetical protein